MLRFLADEDLTRAIVRGVLRTRPDIDIVRVQDVGLRTEKDPVVLDWAAGEERVRGRGHQPAGGGIRHAGGPRERP